MGECIMKNYNQIALLLGITACSLEQEVGPVGASSGSAGAGGTITTTQSVSGGNGGVGGVNAGGEALGGYGGHSGSTETGGSNAGGNNSGGSYTGGSSDLGGAGGAEDCEHLCGKFVTYSQGGWNNQFELLSKVIGNGMLIGKADADYASFTNADAVVAFLPAGGTPDALQGQYVNPLTTEAGTLAGQTLALKLNATASGEACGYILGDLLVVKGPCENKTVYEVMDLSDRALAGEEISLSYSGLNQCAEGINLNFRNGTIDNRYLKLP